MERFDETILYKSYQRLRYILYPVYYILHHLIIFVPLPAFFPSKCKPLPTKFCIYFLYVLHIFSKFSHNIQDGSWVILKASNGTRELL